MQPSIDNSNLETHTSSEEFFPLRKQTVPVNSIFFKVSSDSERSVDEAVKKIFETQLEEKNKIISSVRDKIADYLSENDGWVLLSNGLMYFQKINSLLPPQTALKYESVGEWPKFDKPIKMVPGYLGVLPTISEWELISKTYLCDVAHKLYVYDKENKYNRQRFQINTQIENKLPDFSEFTSEFIDGIVFFSREKKNKKCITISSFSPSDPHGVCIYNSNSGEPSIDYPNISDVATLPIFRLHSGGEIKKEPDPATVFLFWCIYDLTPEFLKNDKLYSEAKSLIRNNYFAFNIKDFCFTDEAFLAGKETFGVSFTGLKDDIISGKDKSLDSDLSSIAIEKILSCDVERADIKPKYSQQCLLDPNGGHWDLWGVNQDKKTDGGRDFKCDYYARNPKFDIKNGGIIGIDFGTKSTTVVCLKDDQPPRALRIGNGNYSEEATKASDYENPTVIQFLDLQAFLKAYNERDGRPRTKWADVWISNAAATTLKDSDDSKIFPSFLKELKQWAGGNHILRIVDKNGFGFDLPPFVENESGPVDPIEIYAYYLGLHINNMHRGIFLHYQLSYPVTYDKPVLEKLQRSFERGIRKSLPESILNDSDAMADFWVKFGASEPAAYSLCALQEYGFDPDDGEKIFYGVFDFGGGTTDFDYGIFRAATEQEEQAEYYQCLEHFRPSGDKFLGGENLLQLISFEVFRRNHTLLREKEITFPKPYETENTDFNSDEGLVVNSPESQINMYHMMEKLRPIWENPSLTESLSEAQNDVNSGEDDLHEHNSAEDAITEENGCQGITLGELQSGTLKINLLDKNGKQQPNTELNFDFRELLNIIEHRIEEGVTHFFAKLLEVAKYPDLPNDIKKVHIFLAGNSSKSPLVPKLFQKAIDALKEKNPQLHDIEVFPPLGTSAAFERINKQKSFNCNKNDSERAFAEDSITRPTGKTGVAFGLIMCREDGGIKVIDKDKDEEGRTGFRFYVGKERKGKFVPILTMDTEKNKWFQVLYVSNRISFALRFSDLPEAGDKKYELPITKTRTVSCPIKQPEQKDFQLFIRIASANEIEYAVAQTEQDITPESIIRVNLEDKNDR